MKASTLLTGIVSGLAGGLAWFAGMRLLFGPAQSILADPQLQSEKFRYVVLEMEPITRTLGHPEVLISGLLVVGMVHGLVFSLLGRGFTGSPVVKGMKFGVVSWALMTPWFEFYLPWNVMHEPLALVLLEVFVWFWVLQLVGITIAVTCGILLRILPTALERPPDRAS